MLKNNFENNFNFGSILPSILLFLGFYSIYLLITNKTSSALIILMIAFIVYVLNNIILNITKKSSVFNEYLEDMASFLTFGVSTIIFGFLFYKNNIILMVVFFYSISIVLALARNWILQFKNSLGWPIPLNGIFFPITYYIYFFYLSELAKSIFIIYYIIISFLSLSRINFLGYKEKTSNLNSKENKNIDEINDNLKFDSNKNKLENNEKIEIKENLHKINEIIKKEN